MDTVATIKPTFEECLPEITRIVRSRKSAWTYVSIVEWSDISQELLMRAFIKWHTFDPSKGRLENWLNTLISNAMSNKKRDDCGNRWSRPCVGGGKSNGKSCVYNSGGESCTFTKSGKQCNECPLFEEWTKKRQHQFNIKSTVSLENHAQEVSTLPQDFCDIEGIKKTVDDEMRKNLTKWEYRIYTALYIEHLSPTATGAKLEAVIKTWKRAPREDEGYDYQFILSKQRWYKELMFSILKREGYDLEAFLNYEH